MDIVLKNKTPKSPKGDSGERQFKIYKKNNTN
jgi:hypothetical protein